VPLIEIAPDSAASLHTQPHTVTHLDDEQGRWYDASGNMSLRIVGSIISTYDGDGSRGIRTQITGLKAYTYRYRTDSKSSLPASVARSASEGCSRRTATA
jgi:hypothetical protein